MFAFLTAPGTSADSSVAGRNVLHRARHWGGWPACAAAARVAGVGYLVVTLVLVACGLMISHVLAHSVGRWDDHVNALFARHRTPTDNRITGYLTVLANAPAIIAVAVVASVIAAVRHRARLAVLLVVGLAVELAAFLAANYIVARPRPHVSHLGSTPSTFSWPSGHVAATFVLYGGIALIVTVTTSHLLLRIISWAVATVLTVGVGLSRIYRGEHHPTDAIAGLLLGAGALLIAALAVRAWADRADRAVRTDRAEKTAATAPHADTADEIPGAA